MTQTLLTAFTAGLVLGLSAGLTPGPMLTFALAQTLKYNVKEGLKTVLAPLLSDAPIIWIAWQISAYLAQFQLVLALVSLAGGALLFWLGYESWRTRFSDLPAEASYATSAPRSLARGMLLNLLNPHPWLFWLMIGVPFLTQALQQTLWAGVLFTTGFYLLLIGSKVVLVLLLGRARGWLSGRRYELVMRSLGVLLWGFAVLLLRDGWRRFLLTEAGRS